MHCPRRGDVAFYAQGTQLDTVDGNRPTRSRCVLRGAKVARNRLGAYACGRETRPAGGGRRVR